MFEHNRNEAYYLLKQGYKLSHVYFTECEYIHYEDDCIKTEDGYDFTDSFFQNEVFEIGWKIVGKKPSE